VTVAVRGPSLPLLVLGAAPLVPLMAWSGMVRILIACLAATLLRSRQQHGVPDARSPANEI
jgi:hypothetical protein